VPGVEKVGPKTAARWIADHGSLDGVVAAADSIKGVAGENLRRALDWLPTGRKLVTVLTDCDLGDHVPGWPVLDALALREVDRKTLLDFYKRYDFRSWRRELEQALALAAQKIATPGESEVIRAALAAAKADPGKLTFASQGVGTSAHLAGELFNNLAGVNMTHVPYKGAGPALNDLLGGQVNMMFATATAAAPLIESGKVRALGVTTSGRSPVRPEVPSIAEAGVPGYAAESWYGFFVPAGTPAEIVKKLNAATAKAAQSETFRKRVEGEGLVITTGTPKELADYVSAEQKRWAAVVKAAKIEPN
jgi:hypothetical protein